MIMLLHRHTAAVPRRAFSLVELLVVIGIIALLISILLPALSAARQHAASVSSLSNLRQLGLGLVAYVNDNRGWYPVHSSASSVKPRTRWADSIFPFMQNTEVYLSPLLNADDRVRMNKPFAHTCDENGDVTPQTRYYGGYGYNYQYLGNSRTPAGTRPFHANASQIRASSRTIAIADTDGSRNGGDVFTSEGVYVIDPPLMSLERGSRGSRRSSAAPGPGQYGYTGGNDGDPAHRATPAQRNRGKVNVVFCDGHAEPMTLRQMDDSDGDGVVDNGLWNGLGDATVR